VSIALVYLKMLLGFLFLSTFLHKVIQRDSYFQTMRAYHILSEGMVKPFYWIFVSTEAFIAVGLIVSGFSLFTMILTILLLLIYTGAVGWNLLRGHRDLSCGCGGVLESERLHSGIIFRNMLLIALVIGGWVIQSKNPGTSDAKTQGFMIIMAVNTLMFIYVLKKIFDVRRQFYHKFKKMIQGSEIQ